MELMAPDNLDLQQLNTEVRPCIDVSYRPLELFPGTTNNQAELWDDKSEGFNFPVCLRKMST